MSYQAPPILGVLDFAGLKNNIILIEFNDNDNGLGLINSALSGPVLVYTPEKDDGHALSKELDACVVHCEKISKAARLVKSMPACFKYYIFHRIDLMDINVSPMLRGSLVKAQLSLIANPRVLKGANIIVTSGQCEWGTRKITDLFMDLKHNLPDKTNNKHKQQ